MLMKYYQHIQKTISDTFFPLSQILKSELRKQAKELLGMKN